MKKIFALLAVLGVFLNSASAALAWTGVEISGNGSDTQNTVCATIEKFRTVVQENAAVVTNVINTNASTGNNSANDNTNGEVTILTGEATANTNVTNTLNANVVDLEDCACCPEDVEVKISGNGSESNNEANYSLFEDVSVFQDNEADVVNAVETNLLTGENQANRNSGGEVTVMTGPATANTNLTTRANANLADLADGEDGADGSSWTGITIANNGSYTDNTVEVDKERFVSLVQENFALVQNLAETNALTGRNRANDNTNANVFIGTGAATANTNVTNEANLNLAAVGCCAEDEAVEVSGNGTESNNYVAKRISDSAFVFQNEGNYFDFFSQINANPTTGNNEAGRNTAEDEVDPSIMTGPVVVNTNVGNTGGLNETGSSHWFSEVDFTFDFSHIFQFLN